MPLQPVLIQILPLVVMDLLLTRHIRIGTGRLHHSRTRLFVGLLVMMECVVLVDSMALLDFLVRLVHPDETEYLAQLVRVAILVQQAHLVPLVIRVLAVFHLILPVVSSTALTGVSIV